MTNSDDIRREVLAAAQELTAESAALSEALGQRAAYRARWARNRGENIPERLAAELQRVDSPEALSAEVRDDVLRWLFTQTPAETSYWQKRKSSSFEAERARYRRARDRLFTPAFDHAVTCLRNRDTSGIEYVIAFMEADPWFFHSGYLKQKFARYLRGVQITAPQRDRLRAAVLGAFKKGRREDLKEYVSLARKLDGPSFREGLRQLVDGADEGTSERAARALAACVMNDLPGQDLRGGA